MNKKENHFKYKCICMWSKNNEFGFVPNVECPVHGKETEKKLKDCVNYEVGTK